MGLQQTEAPPSPTILGGPTGIPHHTSQAAISSFIQTVPTPSIIPSTAQTGAEKKSLTSGEVGAILACVVFVVIGSLAALHFFLSKRRGAVRGDCSDSDSELERERFRAQNRVRERERVRVGVEVDWEERERWEAWEREQGGRGRAPRPSEVKTRPRLVPVYSHVRHVRKPPAGYFRGYRPRPPTT